MSERPPCRCLLAVNRQDMARTVAAYVEALPEEMRADAAEYRRRLALCLTCDSLRDGTCARCGCYVEARAAKAALACPAVPPRWQAQFGGDRD